MARDRDSFEESNEIVRCICGFDHDDGFTIQCDECLVWQHCSCVDLTKTTVPDRYFCELCNPRNLDPERARQIQSARLKRPQNKRRRKSTNLESDRSESEPLKEKLSSRNIEMSIAGDIVPVLSKSELYKPPQQNIHLVEYSSLLYSEKNPLHIGVDPYFSKQHVFRRPPSRNLASPNFGKKHLRCETLCIPTNIFEQEYAAYNQIIRIASANCFFGPSQFKEYLLSKFVIWSSQPEKFTLEKATLIPNHDAPKTASFPTKNEILVLPCSDFDFILGSAVVQLINKSTETNITTYGLFSTVDLPSLSILSEIKGSIGPLDNLHSPIDPKRKYNVGDIQLKLMPPFVFSASILVPGKRVPLSIAVDASGYACRDGRYIRSECEALAEISAMNMESNKVLDEPGMKKANVVIRLAFQKHPSDLRFMKEIDFLSSEVHLADRLSFLVISTRAISAGEELVVQFEDDSVYHYPCVCGNNTSCQMTHGISAYQYHPDSEKRQVDADFYQDDKILIIPSAEISFEPTQNLLPIAKEDGGCEPMKKRIKIEDYLKHSPIKQSIFGVMENKDIQSNEKKRPSLADLMKKREIGESLDEAEKDTDVHLANENLKGTDHKATGFLSSPLNVTTKDQTPYSASELEKMEESVEEGEIQDGVEPPLDDSKFPVNTSISSMFEFTQS